MDNQQTSNNPSQDLNFLVFREVIKLDVFQEKGCLLSPEVLRLLESSYMVRAKQKLATGYPVDLDMVEGYKNLITTLEAQMLFIHELISFHNIALGTLAQNTTEANTIAKANILAKREF